MSKSPVSICHDKRTMTTTGDNTGKYPVKIKVNFKVREGKKNKYVVRRYHIHPDQVFASSLREFNQKKNDSSVILAQAKAIELYRKGLSVEEFERMYTGSGALDEIKAVFEVVCKNLREDERDGTADSYQQALASFVVFKGEYITFGSITVAWLKSYERWMLKERTVTIGKGGKARKKVITHSINTIGIYCRALRTVFNYAIDKKLIPADSSPFGLRRYIIPSGQRKTKKAFTREEKNAILSHKSGRADVNQSLDFWAFQYFGNGCNMADVAYMKFKHIEDRVWKFDRKKTENTERDKKTIDVIINVRMQEVIARHGNKSLDPDSYVFPILTAGMTSRQRKSKIHDFRADINELLLIAQDEINANREKNHLPKLAVKLTTGTARYTAATLLRKQGIDLSIIAKTLGHGSEATTERYTEEELDTQKMIARALEV